MLAACCPPWARTITGGGYRMGAGRRGKGGGGGLSWEIPAREKCRDGIGVGSVGTGVRCTSSLACRASAGPLREEYKGWAGSCGATVIFPPRCGYHWQPLPRNVWDTVADNTQGNLLSFVRIRYLCFRKIPARFLNLIGVSKSTVLQIQCKYLARKGTATLSGQRPKG